MVLRQRPEVPLLSPPPFLETTVRQRGPAPPSRADPVVCVIDDEESVRRAIERLVRSVHLDVETFASAPEYLQRKLGDRPTCLIVDVRLPGLSGLDLQEDLLAHGLTQPIIFITGHGTIPMSVRAMKAGAIHFLQKPFEDQELLDALHQALEQEMLACQTRAERAQIRQCFQTLTPRERQVLDLVVAGLANKRIGSELGTSEKTIKVHRSRVMQKMGASSLPDLVRLSGKIGIEL
jgi:RNA polymerase sigma factor (sigma-70 family)